MFKRIIFLFVTAMFYSASQAGSVQCDCPEVDAKGTGDTSCSATESGDECTIDFNTFDLDDEQAAYRLLDDLSNGSVITFSLQENYGTRYLSAENAALMAKRKPEALIDLILAYTLVSAVQTTAVDLPQQFSVLRQAMLERKVNVTSALLGWEEGYSLSDGSLVASIRHGCIEIRSDNQQYWGMYKANWSRFAAISRCVE